MAVNEGKPSKIGLLGGSFDPVHLAHIALAETALHTLSLDEVQLIPAAAPWQKTGLAASASQRLHMLQLAVRDRPGLSVNPIEINRGGASYTIDTLLALPGNTEYYWILGSDQLNNFCTWHRWQEVASMVRLVVAQRPGADPQTPQALLTHLETQGRTLIFLPFAPLSISATAIRQRLAQGQTVDHLLDESVLQYIHTQRLYQAA
ncbi:nicotinate (nicotinamide) nucleotide adenylyltransferase [Pusillimonas sp. CC-YST705]|uniref:Probable nicotinate-nucleotide adenylyltransferase n=1 Tax=Mesopusillimonas faecipullorum TaxID=2755040 RepID=A0ABS8CAG9_9BURK|nr:nicotinate (nicotinamide) nucleotide adenylyltransferase [Mesopusillimonas faecipullorum]MCB5362852.1 nicotinate (nicotinamide) nucleotide adenylyltransferase [Mesopusillimonas faecipullorum]